MLTDTHVHVVSRDLAAYPLRPLDPGLTWFTEHPCPADQFTDLMAANAIDQAVLVQAMSAYTDDNRYCVDSANADPARFTAVVYVDLTDRGNDPCEALATWVDHGATGVRVVAGTPHAPDPVVVSVVEAAVDLDVRILLMVMGHAVTQVPTLLEPIVEVPVAIDHCGFPDLSDGPPYKRARPLFDLAAFPNVQLKVSTNALDQATRVGGDPRDFVSALAEAYGPERLQWGSDWSQTHDRPYAELVAYAERAFSAIPENSRRWVEGEAARAFWRWSG